MINKIAVLIPVLNPDNKLLDLVSALREKFSCIVVVNDGSTEGIEVINSLKKGGRIVVLEHPYNKGKGAALKTGMQWLYEKTPDVDGVVTADSDGQHTPCDIERIAAALETQHQGLVLGVRDFHNDVPFRSRFGNILTRLVFKALTGLDVKDTQTGLRGIPRQLVPRLLKIPGDRYEYEMRMLADCKYHMRRPVQVDIATIYIAGNASSHFHPVRDSIKIWSALIKYRFFGK